MFTFVTCHRLKITQLPPYNLKSHIFPTMPSFLYAALLSSSFITSCFNRLFQEIVLQACCCEASKHILIILLEKLRQYTHQPLLKKKFTRFKTIKQFYLQFFANACDKLHNFGVRFIHHIVWAIFSLSLASTSWFYFLSTSLVDTICSRTLPYSTTN